MNSPTGGGRAAGQAPRASSPRPPSGCSATRSLSPTSDWRQPSRLPDWTRGARRDPPRPAGRRAAPADELGAAPGNARRCTPRPSSARPRSRRAPAAPGSTCRSTWTPRPAGWSRRSRRSTTAGAWDAMVELRGGLRVPARLLPLARLLEVVIHHVDLDVGFEIDDIDAADRGVAARVVRVPAAAPGRVPQAGAACRLGLHHRRSAAPASRSRSAARSANLLGWLTNRLPRLGGHRRRRPAAAGLLTGPIDPARTQPRHAPAAPAGPAALADRSP